MQARPKRNFSFEVNGRFFHNVLCHPVEGFGSAIRKVRDEFCCPHPFQVPINKVGEEDRRASAREGIK